MLHILHHCASKYSVGLNTQHWNTEHFEVRISSGSILEWSVIAIAISYGPEHSKTKPLEI